MGKGFNAARRDSSDENSRLLAVVPAPAAQSAVARAVAAGTGLRDSSSRKPRPTGALLRSASSSSDASAQDPLLSLPGEADDAPLATSQADGAPVDVRDVNFDLQVSTAPPAGSLGQGSDLAAPSQGSGETASTDTPAGQLSSRSPASSPLSSASNAAAPAGSQGNGAEATDSPRAASSLAADSSQALASIGNLRGLIRQLKTSANMLAAEEKAAAAKLLADSENNLNTLAGTLVDARTEQEFAAIITGTNTIKESLRPLDNTLQAILSQPLSPERAPSSAAASVSPRASDAVRARANNVSPGIRELQAQVFPNAPASLAAMRTLTPSPTAASAAVPNTNAVVPPAAAMTAPAFNRGRLNAWGTTNLDSPNNLGIGLAGRTPTAALAAQAPTATLATASTTNAPTSNESAPAAAAPLANVTGTANGAAPTAGTPNSASSTAGAPAAAAVLPVTATGSTSSAAPAAGSATGTANSTTGAGPNTSSAVGLTTASEAGATSAAGAAGTVPPTNRPQDLINKLQNFTLNGSNLFDVSNATLETDGSIKGLEIMGAASSSFEGQSIPSVSLAIKPSESVVLQGNTNILSDSQQGNQVISALIAAAKLSGLGTQPLTITGPASDEVFKAIYIRAISNGMTITIPSDKLSLALGLVSAIDPRHLLKLQHQTKINNPTEQQQFIEAIQQRVNAAASARTTQPDATGTASASGAGAPAGPFGSAASAASRPAPSAAAAPGGGTPPAP